MSRSHALNIFQLHEKASDEDVLERLEEFMFPLKTFFLRNVPIKLLWQRRIDQLIKWDQASNVIFGDHERNEMFQKGLPDFKFELYEEVVSLWKLELSNSKSPPLVIFNAKRLLEWEQLYNGWILAKTNGAHLPIEAPKASEKLGSEELSLIIDLEGDKWNSHPKVLSEAARIQKLRSMGK